MTRPVKVEFYLGPDKYGRRSHLKGVLATDGQYCWSIVSDPVSQRDEGEAIRSLTTDQLKELGRVASEFAGPVQ